MYADDIALIVSAARPQTAFSRIEENLERLKQWASDYGLAFSPTKSQMMSLKGGLKPGYTVSFGTQENADKIGSQNSVKYLGVVLDPKRCFWQHIESLRDKSKDMYHRLRQMTSANWGMGRITAKIIYRAVFLPRITYASEIWEKGCLLKKSVKLLCSIQRAPLLAITSCYKTASTNSLSAVAGVLPLDLEIRKCALGVNLKRGNITKIEYERKLSSLMEEWQERYDNEEKGAWTKKMIPDVRRRYTLPLELDYYTSQMLTGHGDFLAQLYRFKLVSSPNCKCAAGGSETVAHVLLQCRRTETHRIDLIRTMSEEDEEWPPQDGAFLKTRRTYEALRKFARKSLEGRSDR